MRKKINKAIALLTVLGILTASGIYDMILVIVLILLNLYSIRTYHFVFDGTGER